MIPESELVGSYCSFMKNAGLISWDLRGEQPPKDRELGLLYAALADIEEDSKYMQTKIRQAGLHKRLPIRDFNMQWLCEEQEHALALRAMARLRGANAPARSHEVIARDPRSMFSVLALNVLRLAETEVMAAYMTLGTIQEFFAISTYRHLAAHVGTVAESRIFSMIAQQEGRHMRFYKEGASALLIHNATLTPHVVRLIFDKFWRPPGVDLLGHNEWLAHFGRLLNDHRFTDRLLKGDVIVSSLPGLGRMNIVERFVRKSRASGGEHPTIGVLP